MYFADLTEYQYGQTSPRADILNIGWLSKDHTFSQGSVAPLFIAKLQRLVEKPVNLYRGIHFCEFCPSPLKRVSKKGIPILSPDPGTTGNGEIRVRGVGTKSAITYVAPRLVHHYVVEHQYLPPQDFIDAVNAPAPSLIAENLVCVRGGRTVFRDVSFCLRAGEALAIEGANGSGKTSLLRMIAGFLAPQAGSIVLSRDGAEISDSEERGKHIGWLGHQDGVKPQMTPAETLHFFADLQNVSGDAASALEYVGLSRAAELPCRYLSAGQKKRLALARLKISARPLWLLDEPLSALDAQGKALLRDLIERHCASGGMVIAATHEPLDVDCQRLVLT